MGISKALENIGIAITRPINQAKKLSALITEAGGTPILFPLIEITPLNDYSQFESVVQHIADYDWAIFISSNAVQNGMPRLIKQLNKPRANENISSQKDLSFAAIGPVTASGIFTRATRNEQRCRSKNTYCAWHWWPRRIGRNP
jgi:uroporphyrinogen-III synthase